MRRSLRFLLAMLFCAPIARAADQPWRKTNDPTAREVAAQFTSPPPEHANAVAQGGNKPMTAEVIHPSISTNLASNDGRRTAYLQYCVANAEEGREGIFSEIARLAQGLPLGERVLNQAIAFIDSNRDCNDFTAGALLRLLYLHQNTALVSPTQKGAMERCLREFTYWWDEDLNRNGRCYWTENHQIIFHSDELLAGQLFKDQTFRDGKTGQAHVQHAQPLITQWMDWRVRFGFSEWLSNTH